MICRQVGTTMCTVAFVLAGSAGGDGATARAEVRPSSQSPPCSVTAPIAPHIVSTVPTAAPSNTRDFYTTLYQAAGNAAAAAGIANPLTVQPVQLAAGNNIYYALAATAYIWGLPVELFWEKQGVFTNKTAPINQLYLSPQIDRSAFIVSPNTDVLHANGFLDLSRNPQAITYPQADTFNVLQIMDAYTNVQGSVGTRVNACGEVVLYWAQAAYAPQVKAAYPYNSIAMYSPQVWLIGRVAVDAQAVQTRHGAPQTLYQHGNGSADHRFAIRDTYIKRMTPAEVEQFGWFCRLRRGLTNERDPYLRLDPAQAARKFGTARFRAFERVWEREGKSGLWSFQHDFLLEKFRLRRGAIRFVPLTHQYLQLTPLIGVA